MRYLLLFLLIVSFGSASFGQAKPLVQFSGVVYNLDSNLVVPYVSITNKTGHNKVFSGNYQGYFSFVAAVGDTIVFSAVGYRKEAIVIPEDVKEKSYTVVVKMKALVYNLPAVAVLPWASVDQFNKEFMELKFADDDLEIARKNLSRPALLAMTRDLPRDGQEMQGINFQNNHIALTNKAINQRYANPLLNPFAWGAFIKQIVDGGKDKND